MSDVGEMFISVHIRGKVQGVGFRAWTLHEAARLGLGGSVRNLPDGGVAAEIFGPAPAVREMLEKFWMGPRGASVSSVESRPLVLSERPADFRITR